MSNKTHGENPMAKRRLLFSWIGDTDLLAWGKVAGGAIAAEVGLVTGKSPTTVDGSGPVRTITENMEFDEVHLLSDKPAAIARQFAESVGSRCKVHPVKLASPIDYRSIFEATDSVLQAVTKRAGGPPDLTIHLSSGTPAMTAIWVLLGKSRYPASFVQTHRGKVIPTEIPFDLLVDYVPSVLHGSDLVIEKTASGEYSGSGFEELVGSSPALRQMIAHARRIAMRDVGVLILGESGVGKEVLARAIHGASRRASKAMVTINCAAIPRDLMESELFGHKRGSFSGAIADRVGAFELANGGTLFLDEIGECDPSLQAKLLRVLQPSTGDVPTTRRFNRVGESHETVADVRVLAATNRDLQEEVRAGRFREDLYYRIAAFTLRVPSLRDRSGDVPMIADHLLARINAELARTEPGYQEKRLTVAARRFLASQQWPGNVRQLQSVLLQAAVLVDHPAVSVDDLEAVCGEVIPSVNSGDVGTPLGPGFSLQEHLEQVQRRFLARAMREARGKKTEAARLLGYANYQTLAAQLERLQVDWLGD